MFKIILNTCCGLDVHKTWIHACVGITDNHNRTLYHEARPSLMCGSMDQKLNAFIAIVETGSFSEAAEKLYLSQSALSQQVRTLEKQLGFDLFNHQSRRMKLTQAGEAFYPHARQLVIDYANAVREGKFWEQAERAKKARLRIGCLNEQYFHIWQNLLTFSREIEDRYAPVCMRYESCESLYRAIQMNKADITFQLRDSQIEQYGLTFVPLTSYPLLCIPAYLREPLKAEVTFEELSRYRLAFHYGPGNTLYEDNLRTALRAQYPGAHILEPEDFFSADYGTPTLILVPEIDYTGDPSKASRMVWNGEIPAGFIHGDNVSDTLLAFEQWIQDNFQ